ncbi:competence protein CoiA family protein (plasmid) [Streptomyces sp. NBC_00445]|uniref:competence protein CoiA family protein n=1 Tax=Streptomyces sp. NBC_00445 TaxID=2975745 RepID=UPI002E1C77DC
MPRDQRLVQTAVMGGAESEVPALLPMNAEQARLFLRAHAEETFWCGQWLGGCRGRLTVKMPTNRVAHFAHVPGPGRVPCRRASVGVSGADHLYIRQQILAWLASQGITAAARLPQDAEQPGSEVLFEPGGHGCLRVLLGHDAVPGAPMGGTQLVLGEHVVHDPHHLTLDGYVLRIRCDTDGHTRRVMIGTQLHGRTEWVSLDECSLQPWGLSTPAVEEVRRLRSTSRPLTAFPRRAAPAQPGAVARPVAAPQAAEDRHAAFDALREAVEGERSTSDVRHCLAHAEAAVLGGASAQENDLLRRAADLLLRRVRGVGVSAPPAPAPRRGRVSRAGRTGKSSAGQAAEAVADLLDALGRRRGRLRPGEQQRLVAQLQERAREAGPWLTRQQRKQITAWETSSQPAGAPASSPAASVARVPVLPAAAVEAPARRAAAERPRGGPPRPSAVPTGIDAVADAVRDVLEHTARLGTTIGWDRLCAQVKGLRELNEAQQLQALQAASARSRSARPLAALITTDSGTPHPHYRHFATTTVDQTAWQRAVEDVHASYRPGLPPPGARPGGSKG